MEPGRRREEERRKQLRMERGRRASIVLGNSLEDIRRAALMGLRQMAANDGSPGLKFDSQFLGVRMDPGSMLPPRPRTVAGFGDDSNRNFNMSMPSKNFSKSLPKNFNMSLPDLKMSRQQSIGSALGSAVSSTAWTPKGDKPESRHPHSRRSSVSPLARRHSSTGSDSPLPMPPGEKQPSMLKIAKRRNSLCDKLLEEKLARVGFRERRKLLLEGGRRGSFSHGQGGGRRVSFSQPLPLLPAGTGETIPFYDPNRLSLAFRACANSGVVTVGSQLATALSLLGHPYPFRDVLDRIIQLECAGRESLDMEDFFLVVNAYEDEITDRLEEVFTAVAGHRSYVTSAALPGMLREMGVPAMTGMREELLELVDECDFEGWESIYDDVVTRAGLTQEEYKRLRLIFEELEGLDGTISVQELLGALSWHESLTDLAGGVGVMSALVEETLTLITSGRMTLDHNGWKKVSAAAKHPQKGGFATVADSDVKVSSSAFLGAASMLHRRITQGLQAALKKLGLSNTKVPSDKLLVIFEELGFLGAVASDVDSFLLACNLQAKQELSYEEFFTIIFRYCQADGVTEDESKDINAVFKRFDEDESGTLEATEIGPVIRWLGYQPTQYRVYDFAEEIGLNSDSHIDALEFRRLAAKYKSMSLKNVRKAFLHKDRASDDHKIALVELERLLHMVGYEPTREEVLQLVQQAGGKEKFIDFHEFKMLELLHRRWVQQTMSRNGGFTDGELESLHRYFLRGDPNSTGFVTGSVMRDLFFSIFPDTSRDRHRHSFIVTLMKAHNIDSNSYIDFDEFLEVAKEVQEEIDRDMLIQGLQLRQELGFTGVQVKQFRDLFRVADDDNSGDIDYDELCAIFQNLMVLDVASKRELMALVMEVGDGHGRLDFWAFLRIMHQVQSTNWRHISATTRG